MSRGASNATASKGNTSTSNGVSKDKYAYVILFYTYVL